MAYRATLWLLKRFSFSRSKHQKGRCLEADCQSEIKIKENSFLWIQEKFSHNDNSINVTRYQNEKLIRVYWNFMLYLILKCFLIALLKKMKIGFFRSGNCSMLTIL